MKLRKHISRFTAKDSQSSPAALSPVQVAKAYNFPKGINLSKRSVAVIELGGGYFAEDIYQYCDKLGVARPQMHFYGVDGAGNSWFPQAADTEVQLDQCVIAAVAPGVTINTIFAPNTSAGFADAINYAVKSLPTKPDAISISWGGPEDSWDTADCAAMNTAFQDALAAGIGVYCASGDNGSSDGETDGKPHVDFPASSAFVTACGGTRLIVDANGKRTAEKAWSLADGNGATGGGISTMFSKPAFQSNIGMNSMRLVPDVAGNADPASGYNIKADFVDQVVGGTSAVAPLYAALHVLLQSYFPQPLGDLRPVFYSLASSEYFDVIDGSNGDYNAKAGFDLCTGIGVVDGAAVLHHIVTSGHLVKAGAAA